VVGAGARPAGCIVDGRRTTLQGLVAAGIEMSRRALLGVIVAVMATLVLVGADLSGAGPAPATLQATPVTSEEPADVTVTNTADDASTCQGRPNGMIGAGAAAVVGTTVTLDLADDSGPVRTDTVTPDGSGNWSQTYTGLPAGNYRVTGSCDSLRNGTLHAAPQAIAPFAYEPVDFVVTARVEPEPDGDTADAGVTVGPVRAGPPFTG
jgi:hypothetical protein